MRPFGVVKVTIVLLPIRRQLHAAATRKRRNDEIERHWIRVLAGLRADEAGETLIVDVTRRWP
jgi:hypothetical protein